MEQAPDRSLWVTTSNRDGRGEVSGVIGQQWVEMVRVEQWQLGNIALEGRSSRAMSIVAAATLYSRPYRSVVTVPTHDDLTVVSISLPVNAFRAARADIAGHYARTLDEVAPELAERVRAGRCEERWIGAATPGFFRRPYGRGWALVGDAGYVKDPCTAQGITDAFHHAELLAEAIHTGLRDPQAMHAALAGYERRRNDAVMAMYEFTWQRAALEPPDPQMQQLLLALRDDPARTELFFGVFTGSVSVTDFFAAPAQQLAA